MRKSYIYIIGVVSLLFSCASQDSNLEDLIAQAKKEEPKEIKAPTSFVLEDDPVPKLSPQTPEDSTYYNHFIEHLEAKTRVTVRFDGEDAVVSGTLSYKKNGAHVTITTNKRTLISVSGQSENGSLTIIPSDPLNKDNQFRCGVSLNDLQLKNPQGAAINSQLKKRLLVNIVPGTSNTLTSGSPATSDADASVYGKGCLFSEDKIILSSINATADNQGSLTINSTFRNCIAADDYVIIRPNVRLNLNAEGCTGIKTKDGIFVWGGQTTIFTNGETKFNKVSVSEEYPNGVDTVTCAGLKTDSIINIQSGLLQVKCDGVDAKGIKCDYDFTQDGGEVNIVTLAKNVNSSPKGLKTDKNFIVNAGSFYSYSRYSIPVEALGETQIKSSNVRRKSYLIEIK